MNLPYCLALSFALTVPIAPILAQGRLDRPIFFQDGQELLDREIQRLQQMQQQQPSPTNVEHPSQLLTINDGNLRWDKYLFRDAGFSVWMPQGVQSQETIPLETSLGQIPFKVFSTQPQNYRFVAAYSEPLKADILENKSALLTAVRDGIFARTKFEVIGDRPVSNQGYTGRELTVGDSKEILAFQIYAIGQRVYVLAAGEKQVQTLSETAISFFNSFRLLQ
jgi:hypothetical protein